MLISSYEQMKWIEFKKHADFNKLTNSKIFFDLQEKIVNFFLHFNKQIFLGTKFEKK